MQGDDGFSLASPSPGRALSTPALYIALILFLKQGRRGAGERLYIPTPAAHEPYLRGTPRY